MQQQEKPAIRQLPLFRDIAEETFEALMQAASVQRVAPQQQLIRRGAMPDFLHILVEGAVELSADWNRNEAVMSVLRPVSSFIIAACVADRPCLMAARTLEPSRLVLIPVGDLRTALRRDADLAVAMMSELAAGYRSMVRQSMNLKLRNTRQRLAAWLLRQSAHADGATSFFLPVEKRQLASYLGMTPESLSRTLRHLQEEGVSMDGARVTITDRARLAALALPDRVMDAADGDPLGLDASLPPPPAR